jgi:hydrogenase nickel incorporation protein HypA/HybF
MHELGIVFHIAEQVEQVAVSNHVSRVNKVTVEIGQVSAVIPDYLIDMWNWKASKSEILKGCKLEVEMISAVTFCEDCQQTYATVEYGKTCPYCGSEHTYLVQGNEHNIKEIEVFDEYVQEPPKVDQKAEGMPMVD